jgi:hypothetical protein
MICRSLIAKLAAATMLVAMLVPSLASAAQITARRLTLSSSAPAATGVTYGFNFTVPTTGTPVKSVEIDVCDSAVNACTNTGSSNGFDASASTLAGQPTGFGVGGVYSAASTQYSFKITANASSPTAPSGVQSISFSGVRNPTATSTNGYYLRITTFSDSTYGSQIDYGVVAAVATNQIVVSGTMPESLVFCVGTSGTDCTNMTGTGVDLGVFSPTATSTGTSVMAASTNAGNGYQITLNGTTLSSGANTIPAMGTQAANSAACSPGCSSSIGVSQFGSNVRANTTPAIGSDVSGIGSGTGSGGYDSANAFRFFTGDVVASAAGATDNNTYTNSYIVNVGGIQTAGLYSATLTYICTATF